MILEKLTDDEDSFSFFACKFLSFFAISLFSMIVILSVIRLVVFCIIKEILPKMGIRNYAFIIFIFLLFRNLTIDYENLVSNFHQIPLGL